MGAKGVALIAGLSLVISGCAGLNYRAYSRDLESIVIESEGTIYDREGVQLAEPSEKRQEVRYEKKKLNVDEYEINVDVYEACSERNVIVLPSTGCYAGFLKEFASSLASRGYNVFVLDYPGHGDSSGKRGGCPMKTCVNSVHNLIEFVRENYNDNIGIMGSSRGGDLALIAAMENEEVDSVISQGAIVPYERGMLNDIDWRVGYLFNLEAEFMAGIFKPKITQEDFYKKGGYACESQFGEIKKDKKFLGHIEIESFIDFVRYKPGGSLEDVKIPVLIVSCENDKLVPLSHGIRVYKRMREKNDLAELKIIKRGIHLFFKELETVNLADRWFRATLK